MEAPCNSMSNNILGSVQLSDSEDQLQESDEVPDLPNLPRYRHRQSHLLPGSRGIVRLTSPSLLWPFSLRCSLNSENASSFMIESIFDFIYRLSCKSISLEIKYHCSNYHNCTKILPNYYSIEQILISNILHNWFGNK